MWVTLPYPFTALPISSSSWWPLLYTVQYLHDSYTVGPSADYPIPGEASPWLSTGEGSFSSAWGNTPPRAVQDGSWSTWCPPGASDSFSQGVFPAGQHPACTGACPLQCRTFHLLLLNWGVKFTFWVFWEYEVYIWNRLKILWILKGYKNKDCPCLVRLPV